MRIKVSDYIVEFLSNHNINTVFTLTGGFAMHLNDSFYKNKKCKNYYQFHEQACAYSALGYAQAKKEIPIISTTAGIAAINALSPCLAAFQDSVPLLIISGQVSSAETTTKIYKENGIKLRHYAGADSDIVSITQPLTKYCAEIDSLDKVIPILNETIRNLYEGRPGPVLLSICLDIQGMEMNIEPLVKSSLYSKVSYSSENLSSIQQIKELIQNSQRPIIIAGNGIKLGKCEKEFINFLQRYKIPVVTTLMSTDIIQDEHDLYVGRIGIIGQRAGNFALQNSDLIISLGCRMAQAVVGYQTNWFGRAAKIIYIDIDKNELAKKNLNYTLKLEMDLKYFFEHFCSESIENIQWNQKCLYWKKKWYQELPPQMDEKILNPYPVLYTFFNMASDNKIVTCSSGSIVVVIWHTIKIKSKDQLIISSQGDMGFEIPAAIGAQMAQPNKSVIAICGDGSFQLNIQELQTIVNYKLPVKILLFNNGGYGAIMITQQIYFKSKYGCDAESDLGFPNHEKLANAYGIKYLSLDSYSKVENTFKEFLECEEPIILEIFCCIQTRVPKLSAIKNKDGSFLNRPLEDLEPFMSREEIQKEMMIDMI